MTQAADLPAAPPKSPSSLAGPLILFVWLALGVLLQRSDGGLSGFLTFAFVMVGWVLAVVAHEFGHAGVAYLAGDHTVREKGYLSFDPRRYGDVGTSLVLPLIALALGGVGFPGGAVYLRHDLMRGPVWRAAASLAGPFATLLVLLLLAAVLHAWPAASLGGALYPALTMLAFLQAMALVLNLLPLPGLDGFNAIRPFLPESFGPALRKTEGLTIVILLVLIFVVPGASAWLFAAAASICAALGLDLPALQAGWRAFHFWR
ncbi:site-2 protease family protein [Phenylobacterium deserti]|uniref:site-2 protease family protein n=1 Tax=Phenylobacterium deserti TaxID=1914756 RepID=UPI001F0BE69B|nr:site-2 protease family protein [Phenylobacterium deserti]